MNEAAALDLRGVEPHLPQRRRRPARAARRRSGAARRRDRGAGRAVRHRQEHAAASGRPAGAAGCAARCWWTGAMPGALPDAERTRDPARPDRLRLSVPPSAGRVLRAGERRAAADDRGHGRGATRRRGRRRCWPRSAWRRAPGTCRASCPAASSSASRSPARWPTRRGVLLADEPTGNLDVGTGGRGVRRVAARWCAREGVAALIATHNPDAGRAHGPAGDAARRRDRRYRLPARWTTPAHAARRLRPSPRPLRLFAERRRDQGRTRSPPWRATPRCRRWRSPTPATCSARWSSARPAPARACSRSSAARSR